MSAPDLDGRRVHICLVGLALAAKRTLWLCPAHAGMATQAPHRRSHLPISKTLFEAMNGPEVGWRAALSGRLDASAGALTGYNSRQGSISWARWGLLR